MALFILWRTVGCLRRWTIYAQKGRGKPRPLQLFALPRVHCLICRAEEATQRSEFGIYLLCVVENGLEVCWSTKTGQSIPTSDMSMLTTVSA